MNATVELMLAVSPELEPVSKEVESSTVPDLPNCSCGEKCIVYWNGNCYCSKTYFETTSNKNKNGCESTGWKPVFRITPEEVEKIFGRKPARYNYSNK